MNLYKYLQFNDKLEISIVKYIMKILSYIWNNNRNVNRKVQEVLFHNLKPLNLPMEEKELSILEKATKW